MSGQNVLDRLKSKFGDSHSGAEPRGHRSLDRSRARRAGRRLPATCATSPTCGSTCSTASRASTTSSPTRRRPPRSTWQPHLEVVYHLSSVAQEALAGAQGDAAALEERQAGRIARGADASADVWRTADWHEREVLRPVGRASSSAIPTCGASSAPKTGSAIRCAKTTRCRWNITAFAADRFVATLITCNPATLNSEP